MVEMCALKVGDGALAITETAWKRIRKENKELRAKNKRLNQYIADLREQLAESERIRWSQTERLVVMEANWEILQEQLEDVEIKLKENAA
jgi:septal ring factor EnvC (AmiA/AmiB activator)